MKVAPNAETEFKERRGVGYALSAEIRIAVEYH